MLLIISLLIYFFVLPMAEITECAHSNGVIAMKESESKNPTATEERETRPTTRDGGEGMETIYMYSALNSTFKPDLNLQTFAKSFEGRFSMNKKSMHLWILQKFLIVIFCLVCHFTQKTELGGLERLANIPKGD